MRRSVREECGKRLALIVRSVRRLCCTNCGSDPLCDEGNNQESAAFLEIFISATSVHSCALKIYQSLYK